MSFKGAFMTTIYLLRHGETEWNRLTKLQGRKDIELSDTGRIQARHVAEYFLNITPDVIYSSPLKRAYETAEIIVDINNLPKPIVVNDLMERDYGLAEGYTALERKVLYPDGKYPEMEDTESVCKRMIEALSLIASNNHDKTIVIVSHGSAINAVLGKLSNYEIGSGKTKLHTCSVNKIISENEKMTIEYFNKKVY